jgi:hypothetical protein
MFAYESLSRCPSAFRSLTGMNPAEFDSLLTVFLAAQQRLRGRTRTNRQGQPRQRAAGAGHPFRHDARHRLLMGLVCINRLCRNHSSPELVRRPLPRSRLPTR